MLPILSKKIKAGIKDNLAFLNKRVPGTKTKQNLPLLIELNISLAENLFIALFHAEDLTVY